MASGNAGPGAFPPTSPVAIATSVLCQPGPRTSEKHSVAVVPAPLQTDATGERPTCRLEGRVIGVTVTEGVTDEAVIVKEFPPYGHSTDLTLCVTGYRKCATAHDYSPPCGRVVAEALPLPRPAESSASSGHGRAELTDAGRPSGPTPGGSCSTGYGGLCPQFGATQISRTP